MGALGLSWAVEAFGLDGFLERSPGERREPARGAEVFAEVPLASQDDRGICPTPLKRPPWVMQI